MKATESTAKNQITVLTKITPFGGVIIISELIDYLFFAN
jgi:hypothetical protein